MPKNINTNPFKWQTHQWIFLEVPKIVDHVEFSVSNLWLISGSLWFGLCHSLHILMNNYFLSTGLNASMHEYIQIVTYLLTLGCQILFFPSETSFTSITMQHQYSIQPCFWRIALLVILQNTITWNTKYINTTTNYNYRINIKNSNPHKHDHTNPSDVCRSQLTYYKGTVYYNSFRFYLSSYYILRSILPVVL